MTDQQNTVSAGGAHLAATPGRPARFKDPARNAAYWARIELIVDAAPALSDDQRARIRAAFHQPAAIKEAA